MVWTSAGAGVAKSNVPDKTCPTCCLLKRGLGVRWGEGRSRGGSVKRAPGLSSWRSGGKTGRIFQSTDAGTFFPWVGMGSGGNAFFGCVLRSLHPQSRNLLNTLAGEG